MKKLIFLSLAVPLFIVALSYSIGAYLPNEGVRFTTGHISTSPRFVWQAWSEYARETAIKKVEILPSNFRAEHLRWRVTYSSSINSNYSCDQIIEMEPSLSGTKMTITENWKDSNPLDKLLRHSLVGYRSHMANIYEILEKRAHSIASAKPSSLL